jgi:hypothetical protein
VTVTTIFVAKVIVVIAALVMIVFVMPIPRLLGVSFAPLLAQAIPAALTPQALPASREDMAVPAAVSYYPAAAVPEVAVAAKQPIVQRLVHPHAIDEHGLIVARIAAAPGMVEGESGAAAGACLDAIGAIETRRRNANADGGGGGNRDAEAAARDRAADHRTTDRKRVQGSHGDANSLCDLK